MDGGEIDLASLEKEYRREKENFDNMENYKIKSDFFGIGYSGQTYGKYKLNYSKELNKILNYIQILMKLTKLLSKSSIDS